MAIKTISLELDAYERLKRAKRGKESFSSVVRRATRFLQMHSSASFYISVISVTEFLEGFERVSEGERILRCYARLD